MKTFHLPFILALWVVTSAEARSADALTRREWKVDGVAREALVYIPPKAKTELTPVVFAFHGHGGSMNNAMRMYDYHTLWPEAMVVYMQGLNSPGKLTDPEGKKPGWQHGLGEEGDRDLKFFDTVLAALQDEYRVDEKRIYSTGHSNGGGFTYLLWAARGNRFAAFAPSACAASSLFFPTKERSGAKSSKFIPKPVLHVAGENDPLVKFEWQKQTMAALRKRNECGEGKPWGKGCTVYESKVGAPVVTFIHPGTHKFPEAAPAVIVKFFKEQAKP